MVINFKKCFWKDYKRFPEKINEQFNERLIIFKENPLHPILRNHKLHGEFAGYRSINITANIRAIYQEINPNTVSFIRIGTHNDLYQ